MDDAPLPGGEPDGRNDESGYGTADAADAVHDGSPQERTTPRPTLPDPALPDPGLNDSALSGPALNDSGLNDSALSRALATELWSPDSTAVRRGGLAASSAGRRTKHRRRSTLLVRGGAAAALCGITAAVIWTLAAGAPESPPQSGRSAPPVPAPSSRAPSPSPTPSKKPQPTRTPRPVTHAPTTRAPAPQPAVDGPRSPVPGPTVEWLFDQLTGGVVPDTSGHARNGTFVGAARAPRTTDGALTFDGHQFVAANGPLVDTSRSFSVSAWVRLNGTGTSQTVASQDSTRSGGSSGFLLQYDAEESQWEMRIPEGPSDAPDSDADEAVSDVEVRPGRWTHLTGVYDRAAGKVRLYVDGRPGESVDHEPDKAFATGGNFVAGRGLADGQYFQGVDGALDDVRVFGRAVSPTEARALARKR